MAADDVVVTNLPNWAGWTFTLSRNQNSNTVSSLCVQAPPDQLLTADQIRRIPVGMLLRMAHEAMPAALAAEVVPDPGSLVAYSPEHLKAVVRLYRAALSQILAVGGVPHSPRGVIADHFEVSRVTVDRWLARARADLLLGSWADEMREANRLVNGRFFE